MQFDQLPLAEPLLRAVKGAGYTTATPIQEQAIPPALEGRDLLGCAQTGTGKTAAFALPLLQRLAAHRGKGRPIRALVVTPTRELAAQIGVSIRAYGRYLPLRGTVIFGGVSQHSQVRDLVRGVDILVATPGRLLDLVNQRHIRLDRVEILVLDEADRMLDMGFINDIRKIVALVPEKRQTMFFSATMPPEIRKLAANMLVDPVDVAVTLRLTAAETVDQSVYFVARDNKQALLAHLAGEGGMTKLLVFTRTKHGADRVVKRLARKGIAAAAIHGNKSQNQRTRALDGFRRGTTRILVASDLAARGLDIDDVSHVVNFDLPNEPETYVHRIGRTGRAGATGDALSFCAEEELEYLRDIERAIHKPVPVDPDHPFHIELKKMSTETRARASKNRGRSGSGRRKPPAAGERTAAAPSRRRRPGRPPAKRSDRPTATPAGAKGVTKRKPERKTERPGERPRRPRPRRSR